MSPRHEHAVRQQLRTGFQRLLLSSTVADKPLKLVGELGQFPKHTRDKGNSRGREGLRVPGNDLLYPMGKLFPPEAAAPLHLGGME